jgi:2-polyprenyl-6-methoxyphenol hydroxylase-like FAD-dependent oxidoreductase
VPEDEAQVLIVGAGPVGLTAAVRLAAEGIRVLVLEAEPYSKTDWRASTFHCATLEVLEPVGVVPRMLAEGLRAPKYQVRERHGDRAAMFDFGVLATETAYPFRLQLNQQHLVRMLHERLKDLPSARVLFDTRVVGLTQDSEVVTVDVQAGDGQKQMRGQFLFGADGASSAVRGLIGTTFEGLTYAERFVIVSVTEDLGDLVPDLVYVNYLADPTEFLFVLRTPESWRVLFPIPPDEPDAEALIEERLQRTLQGVAARPAPYTIIDRQIYKVHQRVAGAMRAGRVLLMGDAAHVNSPIGGVGLNSGIHDASDAAVRLARVFNGADLDAELDAYDAVRRRVALDYVQADTHRNTLLMQETDAERRWKEVTRLAEIAADPEQARAYLTRVSLLESIRRFGIGRAPKDLGEVLAPSSMA